MEGSRLLGRTGRRALAVYFATWAIAVGYLALRGADWTFPIASLLIFGLIFSGLIWFLTRRMDPAPVPVAHPKRESLGLLAYIVIYSVLFIGIWLGSIKHAIPPGPSQELAVVGYKLLIHVAAPAAIILALGSALRPLFDSEIRRHGFWPTLTVLSRARIH
jgi:hypothetical protein